MRGLFLVVALGLLATLVGLRLADPKPLRNLREAYFDVLQQLAPRAYTALPVMIVDLDEASLAALGQWPWPRDRLAAMVDRLGDLGAAVVVFDLLFPEPDRLSPARLLRKPAVRNVIGSGPGIDRLAGLDNDARFAAAMARMPVVLGIADAGAGGPLSPPPVAGFAMIGADPGAALLPLRSATPLVPELAAAAGGVGVLNVNPGDRTEVIRGVPLVWRGAAGPAPALALEALRLALGQSTIVVHGANDGAARIEAITVGDLRIPTTGDGVFRLRFRHDNPDQYISAVRLLDPARAAELGPLVAGGIVFVGTSAAGLSDTRTTALDERVPGVSIHAQLVEQVLLGDFLTRSDATEAVELLVLVTLGVVVSLVMWLTGPVPSVLAGGLAGAATIAASWIAFRTQAILFDATFPLIGGFAAFSALAMFQYAVADREKRLIRRSFARYVSPLVLAQMDKRGFRPELGGEIGEVTVLFSDIRNFTAMSETMSAHDLVTLLNEVFGALSDEILAHQGTIDKFIGDEIMAFWNAPVPTAGHQTRACLATLAMRGAMARFNDGQTAQGRPPIAIAMGLDCGLACVGNIGSRNRFNYTVIGETVNIAARTQTACRDVGYDILVTAEVAAAAPDLAFLPAGRLALKGVTERTEAFILIGDAALAARADFAAAALAHRQLLDAIRRGDADLSEPAEASRLALAAIDPRTAEFVVRCVARRADYTG